MYIHYRILEILKVYQILYKNIKQHNIDNNKKCLLMFPVLAPGLMLKCFLFLVPWLKSFCSLVPLFISFDWPQVSN